MGISSNGKIALEDSQAFKLANVTSSKKGGVTNLGEQCTAWRGGMGKNTKDVSDQSMTPRWSSLMVPMANFLVD